MLLHLTLLKLLPGRGDVPALSGVVELVESAFLHGLEVHVAVFHDVLGLVSEHLPAVGLDNAVEAFGDSLLFPVFRSHLLFK